MLKKEKAVKLPMDGEPVGELELVFGTEKAPAAAPAAEEPAKPQADAAPKSKFAVSGKGLVSLSSGLPQTPRPVALPSATANASASAAKDVVRKNGKPVRGNKPQTQDAPLPSAIESNSHRNGRILGKGKKRQVEEEMPDFDLNDMPAIVDDSENQQTRPPLDPLHLQDVDIEVLIKMAENLGIEKLEKCDREELIESIVDTNEERDIKTEFMYGSGVIQMAQNGCAFLRSPEFSYMPCNDDIYLSPAQLKRYALKTGDTLVGQIIQPRENERFFAMSKVETVNGVVLEKRKVNKPFEKLTPYYATQRLVLENGRSDMTMRIIDLFAPIGRGQRGLIVAQPRTGKTIILQKIANSIIANNDDITLIVLLIDERPEEVTDMKRLVKAEIVSSTFDEPPERHIAVSEIVMEKAKRLVEEGRHVVILLDSITRLARAYNTNEPHSGRILSGGVDSNALHRPKRFFGAARNIEGGGSLTILATALIDTGSRMDELIFEEFKGTGNMEIHLDRALADRRIFPAINIEKSGTRREELFVHPEELEKMWQLRKAFVSQKSITEAMTMLLAKLKDTASNAEFLVSLKKIMEKSDDYYM